MADLADGETAEVKGSARLPYVLKNTGGVFSCTCPAWRNQSVAIERRTCKHLKKFRGEEAELSRIGDPNPPESRKPASEDGEEVSGPPLLLAQTWTNDVELQGWWMSEKLDGVRAYWDGKQFLSRQGNLFLAPEWFTAGLPETPLDGELWLDRKAFQRTVSIVRRQDRSEHWKELKYVVFDAPALATKFEERVAFLQETLTRLKSQFVTIHQQMLCAGIDHLRAELERLDALGAEGLMLREPGSKYEAGRSSTLLKVKKFHDSEARVVGHVAGAGRHRGRLGALEVELADGTQFKVGTGFSDQQRENPPPVGSLITFRYQELSDRGVPRFPSFIRSSTGTLTIPPADTSAPPAVVSPTVSRATPAPSTNSAVTAPQYFELIEGKSAKFWEITSAGTSVTVRYGRIGTAGQSKTKTFPTQEAAEAYAQGLIEEKTEKGYSLKQN